jgi:hypothetical protein
MQSSLIDTTLQDIISNKKLLQIYLASKSGEYEVGYPFAYNKELLAVANISDNANINGIYFYSWENINYLKHNSVYLDNLEKKLDHQKLQVIIDKIKSEVKSLDKQQLFTALKNLDKPVEITIQYDNYVDGKIIAVDENSVVLGEHRIESASQISETIIPLSHIECISVDTGWLQSVVKK